MSLRSLAKCYARPDSTTSSRSKAITSRDSLRIRGLTSPQRPSSRKMRLEAQSRTRIARSTTQNICICREKRCFCSRVTPSRTRDALLAGSSHIDACQTKPRLAMQPKSPCDRWLIHHLNAPNALTSVHLRDRGSALCRRSTPPARSRCIARAAPDRDQCPPTLRRLHSARVVRALVRRGGNLPACRSSLDAYSC